MKEKEIDKIYALIESGEYAKSLEGQNLLIGILENTGNFYNRRQEALDYYIRKLKAGTIKEDEYKELCLKVEANYRTEKTERTICEPDQPVLAFLKFFEGNPECVFPLKEYEFEGETYMGPNDHDQFLKSCYYKGNYMELPPYEKRDMKMDWIKILPLPL